MNKIQTASTVAILCQSHTRSFVRALAGLGEPAVIRPITAGICQNCKVNAG